MTDPVKIIVGEGSITEVNVPEYNLIQTGGGGGGSGSDGATFFPEVSEEGVISWTNDGGYDNPEPVNIKGPAGNDGNDGEDGEDGVSPTVTFTTITGGHTMTVTDKDHPSGQSINIMDGSGGSGTSDYDDLTDKPSINGTTLSGNKTAAQLGLGTYSKPASGIPQTDLASAVQSKLDNTVVVSDTQPTATENKLWVDTDAGAGSTYQVPTVAEMEAADAGFSAFRRTNNNLVCFGDSWTVGTGIAVADRPTKRFSAIVAKKLNCTEFNFGVGGAGFIRSGNLFSTQINTANSQMTSEQKENTGVVLIVGGVNDYRQQLTTSTQAQFVNGVVSTANLAHSVFPNALIVLGIGNTNLSYFPEKARQWYSAAISACEQQLEYPSLIIKNLYNVISGNTSMYSSDNLHPNESGHGKFGGYIANAILGGGQTVLSALGTVSLSSGVTLDGTEGPTELTLWRVNDEIIVGAARFTFNPAITSSKVIGTIPTKSAPPSNAYYPFYRSDQHVGNIAITASGNVYLIPATGISSIASGFNQQIRYMFGKPTNTDEN